MEKTHHHKDIDDYELRILLRQKKICFGGNKKLKIYGTLRCKSGEKMKKENRVFFKSEQDACLLGYRPCAHCMNLEYKKWKNQICLTI